MIDKNADETLKRAKENALKIARALEIQETVVVDLRNQGGDTKGEKEKRARLRTYLQEADALVAAITENNKNIAAFEDRAVYILSAGEPRRKPAAELLVQNIARAVDTVFAAGGTADEARAAALKQFKETAGGLADPWFKEVAGALNDLAGLGL